jgi:hypothetical protein
MNRSDRFVKSRGSGCFGTMTVADLETALRRLRRRGVHGRRAAGEQRKIDSIAVRLAALQPWRLA